jgi:hypothetical protein
MTGVKTVDLGITRVFWVTTVAAWPALTATEVNAGKDLSKYLLPDYTFGADASTTVSESDITALFDADVPTKGKYKGSLHLFRALLVTGLAGTEDLLSTFTGYPHGYLVRRVGKASTAAVATGDVVDAGEFVADVPQQEAGTGSGYLKLMVPLLSQGYYYPAITLT